MCNLYQLTASAEAMAAVFRALASEAETLALPARIYPDRLAPVVRET